MLTPLELLLLLLLLLLCAPSTTSDELGAEIKKSLTPPQLDAHSRRRSRTPEREPDVEVSRVRSSFGAPV